LGGVLGAALVGVPTFTVMAADPQLERDLTDLRHARDECGHIRQILRGVHDKYGLKGQWSDAEKALSSLMYNIDQAEGAVKQQMAQGK
jgi:hypothetical protein